MFHLCDRGVDDAFVSILLPQTPAHLHTHTHRVLSTNVCLILTACISHLAGLIFSEYNVTVDSNEGQNYSNKNQDVINCRTVTKDSLTAPHLGLSKAILNLSISWRIGMSQAVFYWASSYLVGAVVLGHLLTQQEHTLVPLQLLVHRLVQGITDCHLTKKHNRAAVSTDPLLSPIEQRSSSCLSQVKTSD